MCADAAIYVKANVIHWVGKTAELPVHLRHADTVVDLSDRVVIPGLVCCHHHMYQARLLAYTNCCSFLDCC